MRVTNGFSQAQDLEAGDMTEWGCVRNTITYRGHNDVLFTDIQVGDRTFTVNATTWYDTLSGRELTPTDIYRLRLPVADK